MLFSQILARFFTNIRPEELAEKVAARCREGVWNRVAHRIGTFSGAEARGYIRARAASLIAEETERVIAEQGGKAAALSQRISEAASEAVIRLVQEQFQAQRRTFAPLRKAA